MSDSDDLAQVPHAARARGDRLHLDDLVVGDRFRSDEYLLDHEQLKAFARRYDPQPFHTDEAAADASLFGGLAASGWQTAAITMRLLVDSVPIAGGLIGLGAELRWPNPTRPGDRLHVETRITGITPSASKPDRGIVHAETRTLNQLDEVVQTMTSKLMVFRRS